MLDEQALQRIFQTQNELGVLGLRQELLEKSHQQAQMHKVAEQQQFAQGRIGPRSAAIGFDYETEIGRHSQLQVPFAQPAKAVA